MAIGTAYNSGARFDAAAGVANSPVVSGADEAAGAAIAAAVEAFEGVGMHLPELAIFVHDSHDGCNGHPGVYSKGGDMNRIDICWVHPFIIRHELAHAWEHFNVDDATRREFLELTGMAAWNPGTAHHTRGIERAANIIARGLESRPIQSMHRNRHAEELALFELLTGLASPRISHWNDERPVGGPRRAVVLAPSEGVSRSIVE